MAKSKHQQQHFDIADNDRISKLPDSILYHILSFVPTKDSVTTSCLSKRWRFTWTSVAVLDLSDRSFQSLHIPNRRRTSACIKSFKNFVNMVLILRSHPVVRRFKLQLNNAYQESDVHSWIFSAVTHDVQELSIHSTIQTINLPRIAYNCETLTALKLHSEIELNVPQSVHLPSLKVIHLQDIPTLCNASITRLLSGSLVLEELLIHRHDEDDSKTFRIMSSSLKAFVLKTPECSENHYGILIDAPKLETFELIDETLLVELGIEFKNATSLGKATLSYAGLLCRNF